jgi:hypothetical protein
MASPSSGCSQLDFAVDGGIIVIERGGCQFWEKVLNGEKAGADMVVVVNTPGAEPIAAMLCHLPGCAAITIPSFIIESHEWDALNLILTAVPGYALTISCIDSPLDQRGTVAFQPEYTTAVASTFTVPTSTSTTATTASTTSSATTATATYPMWSKCNTLGLKMRFNNRVCAISKMLLVCATMAVTEITRQQWQSVPVLGPVFAHSMKYRTELPAALGADLTSYRFGPQLCVIGTFPWQQMVAQRMLLGILLALAGAQTS